jgi:hypothetical protein
MITGLTLAATSGIEKYIDYTSLLKILAVGLIAGAGLIAVFSLGLVFLDASQPKVRAGVSTDGRVGTATATATRNYPALIGAGLCFLIVVAGAAYGINVILSK